MSVRPPKRKQEELPLDWEQRENKVLTMLDV